MFGGWTLFIFCDEIGDEISLIINCKINLVFIITAPDVI